MITFTSLMLFLAVSAGFSEQLSTQNYVGVYPSIANSDPSTVATTDGPTAVAGAFQRKLFYANGLFWVWYINGENISFATSADGANWSPATVVRATAVAWKFSTWFDGTYVYYVTIPTYIDSVLFFRRGTPNSDGTVTWNAPEQTVWTGGAGQVGNSPTIVTDSNGYPFIGWSYKDNNTDLSYAYVAKSETNDGTWSASGNPFLLQSVTSNYVAYYPTVTHLSASKIYVVYENEANHGLYGRLYDGTWRAEETIAANVFVSNTQPSPSVVTDSNDNVYVVYPTTTPDIAFRKRTWGSGWGTEITVQANVAGGNTCVSLSIDTTTADLYAFWNSSPLADHIYYKKYSGSWDAAPTDWATESYVRPVSVTSFYQAWNNYIGVGWTTGTRNPFTLRFGFLTLSSVSTTTQSTSTTSTSTTTSSSTASSLLVSPIAPSNGGSLSSYPVKLRVQILVGGVAVQGASISAYVDGSLVCSGTSNSNGYFACSYTPTLAGHTYSWYATASKLGYAPGTSPTWTFTFTGFSITAKVSLQTCRTVPVTLTLSLNGVVIGTKTLTLSCSNTVKTTKFTGLNAGTYIVTMTASGSSSQTQTVTVPPSASITFSIA